MRIDEFLQLLEDHKKSGKHWLARCPAHADRRPSLSIAEGSDGRILLKCHAGCEVTDIVAALGLRMSDLMPDQSPRVTRREVAAYDYRDTSGDVTLYQSVRFEPKDFGMRRPDGRGGWLWNMNGVRRVPYRLPELSGQPLVYVVEGEKDVEALRTLGIVATTNIGGAGKWTADLSRQVRAAGVLGVVIIPDNDEPGHRHALSVAESAHAAGMHVRVVCLPDLCEQGDVSDWLACGGSRAQLENIASATPEFRPPTNPPTADGSSVRLIGLAELLSGSDEPVRYLVPDRIPVGGLVLIAGKPKSGKSTFARALAFEVARGATFMDAQCQRASVLYVALEDKESEVRAHFRRMGATAEPITFLFPQPMQDPVAEVLRLAETLKPGLIVIDTLQRLIRARDLNDYAEVTTKLTPLLAIARKTDAAVVLIHHAGKAERAGADGVLGSTALHGSVDNTLLIKRSERFRTLWSEQRIGPDLEETIIVLDPETGLVSLGPSRTAADLDTLKTELFATIAGLAEPALEKDIQALITGRNAAKVAALRALVADGRVTRLGVGGSKESFRYFTSAMSQPTETDSCTDVPNMSREQGNKTSEAGASEVGE